ncbi:MAG: hypothetical protein R2911_22985 [Caldilineaceae bacterium]
MGGRYTFFTAFVTATTPISETHHNVVTAVGVDDDGNPFPIRMTPRYPLTIRCWWPSRPMRSWWMPTPWQPSIGDTLRYTIRVTNRGRWRRWM